MGIQKSHTLLLTTVPCQARYSGASIDVALGPRTRAEISARCRSEKSVTPYESTGRLQKSTTSWRQTCEKKRTLALPQPTVLGAVCSARAGVMYSLTEEASPNFRVRIAWARGGPKPTSTRMSDYFGKSMWPLLRHCLAYKVVSSTTAHQCDVHSLTTTTLA